MVKLSVERINEVSPYFVTETGKEGWLNFISDFGVSFIVGFETAETLISYETYQFAIINVDNKQSPRDPKLRETVMAIIHEFFQSNNVAMLYLCETGDNRQSMRSRLFAYWAEKYPYRKDFSIISATITDEEGIVNYASLIMRNDNPYFNEIKEEFSSTMNLLSNKPERRHNS